MGELTVETTPRTGGVVFKRSDGEEFFLVESPGGEVVLYRGEFTTEPSPSTSVANYDAATHDMLASAKRRVLAYPDQPKDTE